MISIGIERPCRWALKITIVYFIVSCLTIFVATAAGVAKTPPKVIVKIDKKTFEKRLRNAVYSLLTSDPNRAPYSQPGTTKKLVNDWAKKLHISDNLISRLASDKPARIVWLEPPPNPLKQAKRGESLVSFQGGIFVNQYWNLRMEDAYVKGKVYNPDLTVNEQPWISWDNEKQDFTLEFSGAQKAILSRSLRRQKELILYRIGNKEDKSFFDWVRKNEDQSGFDQSLMQTVRSKYPYGGIFFSSSLSEIVWLAKNWKWKLDPTAPLYTARLSRQDLENLIEGPGFYAGIENYEELVFYSPDAIKTIARSFQLKLDASEFRNKIADGTVFEKGDFCSDALGGVGESP